MPTAREAYLARARARRQHAELMTRYDGLVADPQDLAIDDVVLPANGRLAISSNLPVAAGELRLIVGGEELVAPALAGGQIWRFDWAHKAQSVNVECDVEPATISVYVLDEWQRHRTIAFKLGTYDAISQAYFDAVPGLSDTFKLAVDTLVRGLQVDTDWASLSRLNLYANETRLGARTCVKTLITHTEVKGSEVAPPIFTVNEGYTGIASGDPATSSYLLSNFDPAADATFLDDSAHMGVYVMNNRTVSNSGAMIYGYNTNECGIFAKEGGFNRIVTRCNGTNIYPGTNDVPTTMGHIIAGVRNSGADFYVSKNGVLQNSGAATVVARPSLPSGGLGIFASNPFGATSADSAAIVHFGAGLSDAAVSRISARMNAFMTSLGTNVY